MTLQQQIIKGAGRKPQINAEEIRRSIDFLKSYRKLIRSLNHGTQDRRRSGLHACR